jgi:hypothetical protein
LPWIWWCSSAWSMFTTIWIFWICNLKGKF